MTAQSTPARTDPAANRLTRALGARLFYGWVVVAATTLVLLAGAGVRSAPGVFLLPVQMSLQVDRATVAAAVSLGLLFYGAAGPFSGWLMNRIGLRPLAALGLALTALGMFLTYVVHSPWQLTLAWGVLSGIGTGMIGSVLGAAVAARWFVAQRGLVVGAFGASMSAGQLIFVPLLMGLASSIGWRAASVLLGVIVVAVALPVLLLLRDDPADVGLAPYGSEQPVSSDQFSVNSEQPVSSVQFSVNSEQPVSSVQFSVNSEQLPASSDQLSVNSGRSPDPIPNNQYPITSNRSPSVMSAAVRSSTFWLLAGTFFICGATSNGIIGTHLIPYAVECGIPAVAAASSLALLGAMNFVGTLASGWLTDRYDPRKLLLAFYGFRGLSLLLLPWVSTPLGLSLFAAVFGLDYIATVPPTTTLIADRFGRKHVGLVYGWVFLAHQVGAAGAAWLGGVARDAFGDYTLAFFTAGLIAILAGFLALAIRARRDEAAVAVAA